MSQRSNDGHRPAQGETPPPPRPLSSSSPLSLHYPVYQPLMQPQNRIMGSRFDQVMHDGRTNAAHGWDRVFAQQHQQQHQYSFSNQGNVMERHGAPYHQSAANGDETRNHYESGANGGPGLLSFDALMMMRSPNASSAPFQQHGQQQQQRHESLSASTMASPSPPPPPPPMSSYSPLGGNANVNEFNIENALKSMLHITDQPSPQHHLPYHHHHHHHHQLQQQQRQQQYVPYQQNQSSQFHPYYNQTMPFPQSPGPPMTPYMMQMMQMQQQQQQQQQGLPQHLPIGTMLNEEDILRESMDMQDHEQDPNHARNEESGSDSQEEEEEESDNRSAPKTSISIERVQTHFNQIFSKWNANKLQRMTRMKRFMGIISQYRDPEAPDQSEMAVWKFLIDSTRQVPDVGKRLTKGISKIFKDLSPTDEEQEKKLTFFKRIQHVISLKYPNAETHMFGSSANGLSVRGSSDIDLCVVIAMEDPQNKKVEKKNKKNGRKSHHSNAKRVYVEEAEEVKEDAADEQSELTAHDEDLQEAIDGVEEEEAEDTEFMKQRKLERAFRKRKVTELARFLTQRRMRDVTPLHGARIPIVKFTDPDSGFQCDICINNELAIYNTQLIKDYMRIDPRFPHLVFVIKQWTKMRDLNDPYHGTLSSYCIVLMLIYYLQHVKVLPVLQQIRDETTQTIIVRDPEGKECDCTYFKEFTTVHNGSHTKRKKSAMKFEGIDNTDNVGQLLCGFFRFYIAEFNWSTDVASIRTGKPMTKEDKKWNDPKLQRNYLCVEDPFETDFNVARSLSIQCADSVRYEMLRAYFMLRNARWDLQKHVLQRVQEHVLGE